MPKPKLSTQLKQPATAQGIFGELTDVMSAIGERLTARLEEGHRRGEVIKHNLEYGLGAENVLRDLLGEMLPGRLGVCKGKIVNYQGGMSRHLDLIVYDRLNFPKLFVDQQDNVILPYEGVYAAVEVKTKTTASALRDAFTNLATVAQVTGEVSNRSTNDYLEIRPPELCVFSFHDRRKLETIRDNYVQLSKEFSRSYSFSSYSPKSPGSKDAADVTYLVSSVCVSGKGSVFHMLNGRPAIGSWGNHTFGMFFNSLVNSASEITINQYSPESYLNWQQAGTREVFQEE